MGEKIIPTHFNNEGFYQTIFENATDVILLWEYIERENIFRIIEANPIACERYGYTHEEFIGLSAKDLNTTESYETSKAIATRLLEICQARFELVHVTRDGLPIPSEVSSHLFKFNGRILVVSVARDIAERKKQEATIRQLANYPLSNPNPVLSVTSEGEIIFANPATEPLLECWGTQQGGKVPSSLQKTIAEIYKLNSKTNIEFSCGSQIFSLTIQPNINEGYLNIYALDITEPRQKQAEIESYQQRLEELVAVRTQALNEEIATRRKTEDELKILYQREQELSSALKQQIDERVLFTRALVHELKTPLTPLLTASDFLEDHLTDEISLGFARNIHAGALNMEKRVNELLDLAHGEVGTLKLTYSNFNLVDLLSEIGEYVKPEAMRRGQKLELDVPVQPVLLQADPDRLRQVITNLLSNSFKFTRRGGQIKLRAITEPDAAIISVTDTGSGIDAADLPYLFQPYHLGQKSEKSRLSGLGLGLVLSRMIVELHGGQIWLKSAKGKGSTFSFKIPYTK
ncbi:hypothetical protein DGWBC_1194 [Dehalogenimonas sp. WBC-2]|nr:hypothetical protein DGWBC_1194 [Dehalogenimonas sp. WBC-2]